MTFLLWVDKENLKFYRVQSRVVYVDEVYDKDPELNVPELMETAFKQVEKHEFPYLPVVPYMLKCSNPVS